jgi:protein-L-isoaspartate(D-aspartate) O-methyltransferase
MDERTARVQLIERGIADPRVIAAFMRVQRELFLPDALGSEAYGDHPLPIGCGQTISQPYMVAVMTELLQPQETDVILEVGAGSGYQAAVLAMLVARVITVEILPELAEAARTRLGRLGYANVEVLTGDGYRGLPERGPYDGIIVTCAPDHIPPPLVAQLADGARLVVPVGPAYGRQHLWVVERQGEQTRRWQAMDVAFVPLTGPRAGAAARPEG